MRRRGALDGGDVIICCAILGIVAIVLTGMITDCLMARAKQAPTAEQAKP